MSIIMFVWNSIKSLVVNIYNETQSQYLLWQFVLAFFRKGEVCGLWPGLRPVLLEGGGTDEADQADPEDELEQAGGRA